MRKPVRKAQKKRVNAKQVAFTRFMLIVAVFVLWIGGITVRLVHLQVNQHEWLKERADGQRRDVKKTKMLRGSILDRNDRALAMSVNVETLYADATEIEDVKAAAHSIAKSVGLKENDLVRSLQQAKDDERRYVPIVKGLDDDAAAKINKDLFDQSVRKPDLPRFAGLHWREDQKRSYPQQALAAHVIGFANADGVGQAGIEQSQNDLLFGAVIKKTQERDRLGRVYDESISEKEPPKDIQLTISTSIQFKAEQALERQVKASGARSGMAMVIDQKTGEILAMANYPTFDPNDLGGITSQNLTNGAIQSIYSPGSVFKLITYGSALEKKLIKPDGMIDPGNGSIEVGGHRFVDGHGGGRMSYAEALAHSSNVCAIKTGLSVGKTDFYGLVRKMGFGSRTGIELPAETAGIVRAPERWNGDSLASMSIGYEIGVSALQMATAFATIANDGIRVQPHIIKEIRGSDDQVISAAQPSSERVVSAETARDLKIMMRQVVLDGTAKRAQLNGYTSAGKTGTAWKFDEKAKKVSSSKFVSSFIGFAPAENPAITIAVVMDEPKFGGRDGGQVSAPVFREIAESVLPELGILPDGVAKAVAPLPGAAVEEVPETPVVDEKLAVLDTVKEKVPVTNRSSDVKESNEPKNVDKKVEKAEVKKPEKPKAPTAKPKPKNEIPAKTASPQKEPKGPAKNKSSTEKKKGTT